MSFAGAKASRQSHSGRVIQERADRRACRPLLRQVHSRNTSTQYHPGQPDWPRPYQPIGSGVCRRRVASRWRISEAGQSSGLVLFGHRIVDAKLALTVLACCRQFRSCLVAVVPRSTDQAGDRHRRPNEFAARRWQAGPAEGVGRRPPGGHVA